ncbi:hypothetical protein Zmor_023254 [Zophobas morio]|uniref:Uncharacterized protein n=1 Tax=Zophobas morio TaxID=2755281 RepID=A0AA38I074_9CUCU|nr:hypothetical protein Zmor_023254 [Zophobas morio]
MSQYQRQWSLTPGPAKGRLDVTNVTWESPETATEEVHLFWKTGNNRTNGHISTRDNFYLLSTQCGDTISLYLQHGNVPGPNQSRSTELQYTARCNTANSTPVEGAVWEILIVILELIAINLLLCFMFYLIIRARSASWRPRAATTNTSRPPTPTYLGFTWGFPGRNSVSRPASWHDPHGYDIPAQPPRPVSFLGPQPATLPDGPSTSPPDPQAAPAHERSHNPTTRETSRSISRAVSAKPSPIQCSARGAVLYQNISNRLATIIETELDSSTDEENHVEKEHSLLRNDEGKQIYQPRRPSAQKGLAEHSRQPNL